jgi:hypothetical protein
VKRLVLATFALLFGCSSAEKIEDHPCPQGSTLTYANFGQEFFAAYCVRCHGGPGGYSSRAFTTVESIRASKDRIYVNAAGDNVTMPPGPDDPSEDERKKLADWLACGAP